MNKFKILNMFIENILGTESKIKIIRTLLEINSAFTLEDLEEETSLSRGILHKEIKNLQREDIIVEVQKLSKLRYYQINYENQYIQMLSKMFDLEKTRERRNKIQLGTWNLLSMLTNKLLSNNIEFTKLILFGSVARGTSTIKSDIDLMLVYYEKKDDKFFEIVQDLQNKSRRKINLNFISEKEYNDGKTDLVRELEKEGIVLYKKRGILNKKGVRYE